MAVLTIDALKARAKEYVGDRTEDVDISILEDINDTLDTFADTENWKTKYEENDAAWRKRYTDRFNGDEAAPPPPGPSQEEPEDETPMTYADLFEVRK